MTASCGACKMCCELLAVPDIGKPPRMMCWHTTIHGGCAVHHFKASDPSLAACNTWKCVWLDSQTQENPEFVMPRALRPDISHVVMGPWDKEDNTLLYCQIDPRYPSAWQEPVMLSYLSGIVDRGGKIKIIIDEVQFDFVAPEAAE